jgi:hypothetical protein
MPSFHMKLPQALGARATFAEALTAVTFSKEWALTKQARQAFARLTLLAIILDSGLERIPRRA